MTRLSPDCDESMPRPNRAFGRRLVALRLITGRHFAACLAVVVWSAALLGLPFVGLPIGVVVGAEPSPRLLRLVGADVGLCVELSDGRGELARLRESTWLKRVRATSLFRAWSESDDARKLKKSIGAFEKVVEQPADEFLSDLFGQQAVVAVYPRPNAEPVAVLLTTAASADALDRIVRLWNRLESAEVESRSHAEVAYFRRRDPRRQDRPAGTTFYLQHGALLALSDREELIRDVAERLPAAANDQKPNAAGRTIDTFRGWPGERNHSPEVGADPAAVKRVDSSSSAAARPPVLRGLVQPQIWLRAAGKDGAAPKPEWLGGWASCESVAWEVRFDEGWRADLRAVFPADSASPRWKSFVERGAGPIRHFDSAPADSLVILASRVDLTDAPALFERALPADLKKNWQRVRPVARGLLSGLDLLHDVIPALGPDAVAWIAPTHSNDGDAAPEPEAAKPDGPKPDSTKPDDAKWRLPFEAGALIELTRRPPVEDAKPEGGRAVGRRVKPTVAAALDNALSTGMNLLAAAVNSEDVDAEVVVRDEPAPEPLAGRLRWFEGLPLASPGFAAAADRIVFGSHPDVVRRGLAPLAAPAVPAEKARAVPASVMAELLNDPSALAFVNLAALRESLVRQGEPLAKWIVRSQGKPPEEVDQAVKRLADAADLLGILDEAAVALRLEATEVRLSALARLKR